MYDYLIEENSSLVMYGDTTDIFPRVKHDSVFIFGHYVALNGPYKLSDHHKNYKSNTRSIMTNCDLL